ATRLCSVPLSPRVRPHRSSATTPPPPISPPFPYTPLFRSYPGTPRTGDVVGSWDVPEPDDSKVFHAGTRVVDGKVVTAGGRDHLDRKSTRLNSIHVKISYAVFCLKKKTSELHTPAHISCRS